MALNRIIVADDHPIFREGLSRLIFRAVDDAEVFEVDSFEAVLSSAEKIDPVLFVLDLNFPGFEPSVSIGVLRTKYPTAAIVIVSMQDDAHTIKSVLSLNIDGFISKAIEPIKIGEAVAAVLEGETVIIGPQEATPITINISTQSAVAKLPARQRDVLRLVVVGKTNKEIARDLGLSPFTVRSHVSALLKSLDLSTRAAAAAVGRDAGL